MVRIPRSRFTLPNITEQLRQSNLGHALHIDRLRGTTGIRLGQDLDTEEILWLTDRFRHLYMIGTTGSGKTNLLRQMIETDMREGYGVGVLAKENDQIVEETLPFVPRERIHETVYLNPTAKHPLCINPLELPKGVDLHQHVSELMSIFSSLLDIRAFTQKPLCENMLYALVAHPDTTLANIPDFLDTDPDYRWGIIKEAAKETDIELTVKYFKRFDEPKNPTRSNASFIIDKFTPFLQRPKLRAIMCGKTTLDIASVMRSKGIFVANLSDAGGVLGDAESSLLGAYLITAIKREMTNRQEIPIEERKKAPFMLYIDEFTKYVAEKSNEDAFAEFLIRARKNFVALHLAHQDTADLSDNLNAKLGGAGARVYLNLGQQDAPRAARFIVLDAGGEDATVSANKLAKMTPGECYVSLYHEETKTKQWHHAHTFPFTRKGDPIVASQIIDQSSVIDTTMPKTPPNRPSEPRKSPPPSQTPKGGQSGHTTKAKGLPDDFNLRHSNEDITFEDDES